MRFLVTGTAGFIGFHLARRLLAEGHVVVGIDAMTAYYSQALKQRRQAMLAEFPKFAGHLCMLEEAERLAAIVADAGPEIVIHLAAQAGVRYSAVDPGAYISSNVVGTFNLLQALRAGPYPHLLVASTSAVYGASKQMPFEETQPTDSPRSLYAATKKATEMLAYNFACQSGTPTTALRLFTVYGPWGRPDMAIFKFTQNIIEGRPIEVYGSGRMSRDFTYIDDVIEAIRRLIDLPPGAPAIADQEGATALPEPPYRVVNVGGSQPVALETFIADIEAAIGRKAERHNLPMQPGDLPATWASAARLEQLIGYKPTTPLTAGIRAFVTWYREEYRV